MDIQEVSELLGLCHFLRMPKHIFITQEPVEGAHGERYRGLQPKSKRDSIFITGLANDTTPIHEAVHAMFGTDEVGTEIISRAIIRKNQVLTNFPLLKERLKTPPKYVKVNSDTDYPEAHLPKFQGRVDHYVLEESSLPPRGTGRLIGRARVPSYPPLSDEERRRRHDTL